MKKDQYDCAFSRPAAIAAVEAANPEEVLAHAINFAISRGLLEDSPAVRNYSIDELFDHVLQLPPETLMEIPEIKNDETAIKVIDELKHRLKPGLLAGEVICSSLNDALNKLIKEHGLDSNPHMFASKSNCAAANGRWPGGAE